MNHTAAQLGQRISQLTDQIGRELRIMEVCGTHTVSAFRSGLRSILPEQVRLISGPGCPVCVTAQSYIEMLLSLARRDEVIITTYGDMMRVPGTTGSLESQRACGADIRVVLSSMEALQIARQNPQRQVVFAAVGFETTAPATAAAILQAQRQRVDNFTVLCAHKLVVPAMLALLEDGRSRIDGFLCPGHVSVIIGYRAYEPIVAQHRRPCVVAGFEPQQILAGIAAILEQLATGTAKVQNVYTGVVRPDGNRNAREMLQAVFTTATARWRGLGEIENSGLQLAAPFRNSFDAAVRFQLQEGPELEIPGCKCGQVITGRTEPDQCPLFGNACIPARPVGPCMVSSEGTCAAWYKYKRPAGAIAR